MTAARRLWKTLSYMFLQTKEDEEAPAKGKKKKNKKQEIAVNPAPMLQ